MKKKFALLLAFAMILSIVPTSSFAQVPIWGWAHRTGTMWEAAGPAANVRHWAPGVLVGREAQVNAVVNNAANVDSQGRRFIPAPGGNMRHIIAGADYFAMHPGVPMASIRMEIHNVRSWLGSLTGGPDEVFTFPGNAPATASVGSLFTTLFGVDSLGELSASQSALFTQMEQVFYTPGGNARDIAFLQWTPAASPQLGVAIVIETDRVAHLVLMRAGAGWETFADPTAFIPVPIEYVTNGDTNSYPVYLTFHERSGWPQAGESGRRTNLTTNQPSRFNFTLDGSPRAFHRYGRSELVPLRISEAVQGAFDQRNWHIELNIVTPGFFWTAASAEEMTLSTRFEDDNISLNPTLLSNPQRLPTSGHNRFRTLSFAVDLQNAGSVNRLVNDWLEIENLSIAADDRARAGDVVVEVVMRRAVQEFPSQGGAWWSWSWTPEAAPADTGAVVNVPQWQHVDQVIAQAGGQVRVYRTAAGETATTTTPVASGHVGTFNAIFNQPVTTGVWGPGADVYDGELVVARYGMVDLEFTIHPDDNADDFWLRSGARDWGFDLAEYGAGRRPIGAIVPNSVNANTHRTARVRLREAVPGSLPATGAHPTTFSFNEGIQVLGVTLRTNNANFSAGHNDTYETIWFGDVRMESDNFLNASIGRNSVTIRPEIGETVSRRFRIAQITAEFYLSVQPGFEHLYGDEIEVTVNTGTIDAPFESSVVLAHAWDPITLDTSVAVLDETTEAAFGLVRATPVNDIIISETEAGALIPGTRLWIGVEGGISRGWGAADHVSIGAREVYVEGDSQMQLSRPRQDSHGTYVEIIRGSRNDGARIIFSGVEISGRVVPNHEYSIIVADNAVADNWNEFVWLREDLGVGSTRGTIHGFFTAEPYLTPAFRFEGADIFLPSGPPEQPQQPGVTVPGRSVTLFEGMTHRTADGTQLNSPLFLLIPNTENPSFSTSYVMMRVVADVLGLEWEWEESSQTAKFTDGVTEVVFTHNSPTAMVNGVPMDIMASGLRADARIINERFFVPIAFFRYIFNADVTWNNANRTVTVSAR